MSINGMPNKFEIFQDFYYVQNGVQISYAEALRLFAQMDADTASDFEQYYQDETGYEIIVPSGHNIDQDLGSPEETGKKTVKRKEKQSDGSIKWVDKEVKTWTFGKTVKDENGNNVFVEHTSATTQNAINTKYSLDAYAKKNGLTLDPQWAGYSAEEIIAMADNGVNIPQDVVDMANTILQSAQSDEATVEGEDGQEDTTLSFLELIPEAEKKIDKCEENTEKIENEIQELVPEQQKKKKAFMAQFDDQLTQLEEYEDNIREWSRLNDKLQNGEHLTTNEVERYSDLSEAIQNDKAKNGKSALNKSKIASSLNELNVLSILGVKLAGETIEIGDTLADYTSKANYKTTYKETMGQVGFFKAFFSMCAGKALAKEAAEIGEETKEIAETTKESVGDISELLDIELNEVQFDENGELIENNDETNNSDDKEDKEELFILSDDSVKELMSEAGEINDTTRAHIKEVKSYIKDAKKDILVGKFIDAKVSKIIETFEEEDEARQQEIEEKENENKEAEEKIKELREEAQTENENNNPAINKPKAGKSDNKDDKTSEDENLDDKTRTEIEKYEEIIESNKADVEQLNAEQKTDIEDVKASTAKEKEYINKAVPKEAEAFETVSAFVDEEVPDDVNKLAFTSSAGLALANIGAQEILIGGIYNELGLALLGNIFTAAQGAYFLALGITHASQGYISLGIGLAATVVAEYGLHLEEKSEGYDDTALDTMPVAIEDLTTVDEKIIGVTGEESAMAGVIQEETEETTEEGQTAEGVEGAENGETSVDGEQTAPTEGTEEGAEPAVQEEVTEANETAEDAGVETPATEEPAEETPEDQAVEAPAQEGAEVQEGEGTENPENVEGSPKEKKEENPENVQKDAGKEQDKVDDAADSAEDDKKDSEKIEKDTKKDEKQLAKEAKKLEKQILKEQEQVIKLNEISQKAVEKQQELMVEYEALSAENEQMMAEEEAKQMNQPKQQPAPQQDGEQGGLLASNSFTITSTPDGSDNQSKLDQNSQRINELGVEFKSQDTIVVRNRTKITKLQKSIKTKTKKFEKKTKLRTKKLKETEKKEKEKQKRLSKQLAIVGIAENVFSITSSVGTILSTTGKIMISTGTPMLSNPFTAAAGAALVSTGSVLEVKGELLTTIGTYGTIACGLTKGIINIANGNLAAGLMAIGSAAISAVTAATGTGGASSSALNFVTAGLSIVSSSAEMVNNVRAVQGKEASGLASKISTVAGVGSAVTGAASSVGNMGSQNTLGKIATITSAVGTALSSTSQLMTEFGGDEKTANLLGTIGGGMQTLGSIGQLANKNSNKQDNDNQETNDADKDSKKVNKAIDKDKNMTPEQKAEAKAAIEKMKNDPVFAAEMAAQADAAIDQKLNEMGVSDKIRTKVKEQAKKAQNAYSQPAQADQAQQPQGTTPAGSTPASDGQGNSATKTPPTSSEANATELANGNMSEGEALKAADALRSDNPAERAADNTTGTDAQSQKEAKKAELEAAKQAKKNKEAEAKDVTNKNDKKNMLENGASKEYADLDDDLLEDYRLEAIGQGDDNAAAKYALEQQKRSEYKSQMSTLDAHKQAKMDKMGQILDITGQLANTGMQIAGMFMTQNQEGQTKKKAAAPGKLTKRTKEIMKKNAKYRQRRVQALNRTQRYYA